MTNFSLSRTSTSISSKSKLEAFFFCDLTVWRASKNEVMLLGLLMTILRVLHSLRMFLHNVSLY